MAIWKYKKTRQCLIKHYLVERESLIVLASGMQAGICTAMLTRWAASVRISKKELL